MTKTPSRTRGLPSKAEIRRFIDDSPGKVGKREIARAFGIGGDQRPALKRLLREMADEGLLPGRRRDGERPARASLPSITVIEVTESDDDGVLSARPVQQDLQDAPPITLLPEQQDGPSLGIGDRALVRLERVGEGYRARVMRRLPREPDRIIGVLSQIAGGWRIVPTERRAKSDVMVADSDRAGAGAGDLVVGRMLPSRGFGLPQAQVMERIADTSERGSLSLIAIHQHELPLAFSDEALAEADAAAARAADWRGRTDLRDLPLVTIDGADARDFDDAIWAAPDPDPANPGGWQIIVAIADVAHYVAAGGALDMAARERGNSAYFPDRVVPMLPPALSNEACSLQAGQDRAVLAVRIWLDKNGTKLQHAFERAVMRSAARLTYEQVQAAADNRADAETQALFKSLIVPLYGAFGALRRASRRRQPLDLDVPELVVALDPDGEVRDIRPRPVLDSHRLIELFMIEANVAAAETLERLRVPLVIRVHEPPSREKLVALKELLRPLGLSLSLGEAIRPELFNRLTAKARESEHKDLVSQAILRSQTQAYYGTQSLGHFGLALARYCHFTSPIRRYADLLVHRALIHALKLGTDGQDDAEAAGLEQAAAHISQTERRAMQAERDTVDRYTARYLAGQEGTVFAARIAGVTRAGLFVRLDETGANGLLPMRALGQEFFRLDEDQQRLRGDDSGAEFRLGQPIKVRLIEVTPLSGGLLFEPMRITTAGQGRGGERGRPGGRDRRTLRRRRR